MIITLIQCVSSIVLMYIGYRVVERIYRSVQSFEQAAVHLHEAATRFERATRLEIRDRRIG